MNCLLKAISALACALILGTVAHAQMTTPTASKLYIGGVPIPVGTVTFAPVNAADQPISFVQGGGGLNGPSAFNCDVANGAIIGSCSIPDSQYTTPAHILYDVIITNTSAHVSFALHAVPNVTGSTWALDQYAPPSTTTNVQVVQGAVGPTVPTSCVMPSTFTKTSNPTGLYYCIGGVFVPLGTGGGGSTYVPPTGTGLVHIVNGVQDDNAYILVAADIPALNYATSASVAAAIAAAEAGTISASRMPAYSGDAVSSAGATDLTVIAVNGQAIPVSAPCIGTNAQGQIVGVTCTGGGGDGGTIAAITGLLKGDGSGNAVAATAADLVSLWNSDTTHPSVLGFHTGTLGNAGLPSLTPGSGVSYLAQKDGIVQFSSNGGAFTPAELVATPFTALTDASTVTWAVGSQSADNKTLTMSHSTATRVINITGLVSGGNYVIISEQDSTGGASYTLGTGCTWMLGVPTGGYAASTAPTLTTTASTGNILAFTFDGTACWGNVK